MEPLLKTPYIAQWLVGVLLLCLLIVVWSKQVYAYRFALFMGLITHNQYLFVFNKKNAFVHPFQLLWLGFGVLNTSLFLFLYKDLIHSWVPIPHYGSLNFMFILLGIGSYVIFKQLAQVVHATFFSNQHIIKQFLFKKSSYFNFASGLLFCSNTLFLFVFPHSKVLFFVTVVLFSLVILSGWLLVLKTHLKYIINNIFYFILYLCALEIAPLLIIASILKK